MNLQFRPQTQRKQTVPAKAFPTQMRERGLEAPARPNTLNICTLIVFHCLGHGERSRSQAFKIPSEPFKRTFASIKKTHNALHPLRSLLANLFVLIPLDMEPSEESLMEQDQSLGKRFCCISRQNLTLKRLVCVKQASQ